MSEPLPGNVSTKPVGHSGTQVSINETKAFTLNGILIALLTLAGTILTVYWFVIWCIRLDSGGSVAVLTAAWAMGLTVTLLLWSMITILSPGDTKVVRLFGAYLGTIRSTGLIATVPLASRKKVSIKVNNFETKELKVNDADGNPVNIAAIIVWQVADTAKAVFAVEDYDEFVRVQSESALRHVATTHPYDAPGVDTKSLRGSTDLVAGELAEEVAARVALAGIEILEARISALAYAPEIAHAMLQRQQASAVIAAREKIVEGAVSMVESALNQLEEHSIVELDDERKAAMVSNLLVVLCGSTQATPIVNAGTLYN
ncbi:MAG: SPFH domain-containing protein [Propionibacteriaceae bacterium]|jgi:regulator of protease activity HflC (stomatin/prohibitin superfamily)|nr:SPFH domain-containing protein [Propionibacteriaceae bacterium]